MCDLSILNLDLLFSVDPFSEGFSLDADDDGSVANVRKYGICLDEVMTLWLLSNDFLKIEIDIIADSELNLAI